MKIIERTLYVFRDSHNNIIFETINPVFFTLLYGNLIHRCKEEDAMFVEIPDLTYENKNTIYRLDTNPVVTEEFLFSIHMDKEIIKEVFDEE